MYGAKAHEEVRRAIESVLLIKGILLSLGVNTTNKYFKEALFKYSAVGDNISRRVCCFISMIITEQVHTHTVGLKTWSKTRNWGLPPLWPGLLGPSGEMEEPAHVIGQ